MILSNILNSKIFCGVLIRLKHLLIDNSIDGLFIIVEYKYNKEQILI